MVYIYSRTLRSDTVHATAFIKEGVADIIFSDLLLALGSMNCFAWRRPCTSSLKNARLHRHWILRIFGPLNVDILRSAQRIARKRVDGEGCRLNQMCGNEPVARNVVTRLKAKCLKRDGLVTFFRARNTKAPHLRARLCIFWLLNLGSNQGPTD